MMRKETRGKKSEASRQVVVIRDDDEGFIQRPQPPNDLTAEERDEWRALCAAVPATYFPPATHMVVAQYCRHVVFARHLAQMIRQVCATPKKFDLDRYATLMRLHQREGSLIAAHLRTLRLTHLSAYAHDRAPLPEATPKPWLS